MIVTRVQEQDNNANGYLVCLFQVVCRLKHLIKIYKWCLDQPTSDILQVVLMKIGSVQEMAIIDKSIIHVVSHLYIWYHSYKMVLPQVVLHFK